MTALWRIFRRPSRPRAILPYPWQRICNTFTRLACQPPVPPADYTVVVHWSRFMTRQSRRLIQAVRRNAALAPAGTRVALIFVNTDDFYYLTYKRDDERRAAQAKGPAY